MFFLPGFIADTTGSYVPAFYTFGSLFVLAFLLVFPVYCFKLDKTNDESREIGTENEGQVVNNHNNGEDMEMQNHVVRNHHDNEQNADVVNMEEKEVNYEWVTNKGLNTEEIDTKL